MSLQIDKNVLRETYQAIRPIGVSVLAITIIACVMIGQGWQHFSLLLAGVILLLTGIIIAQVHRSVSNLRRQHSDIQHAATVAQTHYVSVLQRIIRFAETRDKHSKGSSERVGRLAEAMATQMGLDDEKVRLMNLAGQLRDIGMLAISENLTGRRMALGGRDFRAMQKHADISYEMLKPLDSLKDILPAIRHHHERMNGTGYPNGLAGDKLPLEARILAVADSYDAMTHDRPHRQAISPLEAMHELQRCTPAGYDPACVEALSAVVNLPSLEAATDRPYRPQMPEYAEHVDGDVAIA